MRSTTVNAALAEHLVLNPARDGPDDPGALPRGLSSGVSPASTSICLCPPRRAATPSDLHVEARCVEVLGSQNLPCDRPTRLFVRLNFWCSPQPGALRCSGNPRYSRIRLSDLPFSS